MSGLSTATPRLTFATFPATPDQVGRARRYLASIIDGSPLSADALACLGEFLNNSVVHSNSRLPGGTFTVRVETRPGTLRVEVRDNGGPWAPRPASGSGHDDGGAGSSGLNVGGRGLLIVAALADAWDISPRADAPARTAWFRFGPP